MQLSAWRFYLSAPILLLAVTTAQATDFAPSDSSSSAPIVTPVPAPMTRPGAVSLVAWGGASFSDNFYGGYIGAVKALNGDLWNEGLLFRIDGAAGSYRYRSSILGYSYYVHTKSADVMIGYRAHVGTGWLTGYVGPSFQDNDNKDPTARIRGTKWGVKGIAEYNVPLSDRFQASAFGTYATEYSTYFVMGRLGYNVNVAQDVWLGPEASLFGTRDYEDRRVGAFINIGTARGAIGISGGYLDARHSNDDGYYLNLNVSFAFN